MAADPLIWILTRGRKGDLDQMLALAKATGWPFEEKRLAFRGPTFPVLSSLLLKRGESALHPPWPDLVLCAEALPSVIAREIKSKSQGRTRIVCLGRPAGSVRAFDLVITTAQYRIPASPNVVELSMPLAALTEPLAGGTQEGHIALLVGGPAFPDRLDGATAAKLAGDVIAYAQRRNARLSVQTSPRTPPEAVAALQRAILPPHRISVFGSGENRYKAVLAEASEIVVTSDSVSMVSDAFSTGKPVSIYPLPQSHNLKWHAGEWLYRNAVERPSAFFPPVKWLFDIGIIEAAADRRRLLARLVAEKRLVWFGDELAPPQPSVMRRDLETAVQSLRALMARDT
jgi:mitochondrial fission protein ELM1